MTNSEIKLLVIDALMQRDVWMKQVPSNPAYYRTRCPYCGDSQHSMQTGHLYLWIDTTLNIPIVYHCFRCDEAGIMNGEVLSDLDIHDTEIQSLVSKLNKTSDKKSYSQFIQGTQIRTFNYHISEKFDKRKVAYLEERLGISFDENMLCDSKVVTSVKDFLIANGLTKIMWSSSQMQMLEDYYIGFLSYGNSHIMFRCIVDNPKMFRWLKYPLTEESMRNRVFYSMSSEVDIYTSDTITINLTEGIMDVISARYNLGYEQENNVYIGVGGKGYRMVLTHLLERGFIGDNVSVNIFADNDVMYNKESNVPTDMVFFRKILHRLKHYYGNVNIYYNSKGKDIGVPKSEILLEKHRLQ